MYRQCWITLADFHCHIPFVCLTFYTRQIGIRKAALTLGGPRITPLHRVRVMSSSSSKPQLTVPSPTPFWPSSSSSRSRKLRGTLTPVKRIKAMQQKYSPKCTVRSTECEREASCSTASWWPGWGSEGRKKHPVNTHPSACSEMMFIHAFEAMLRQRFVVWPLQSDIIMVLHCKLFQLDAAVYQHLHFRHNSINRDSAVGVIFHSLRSFTVSTKPWTRL